ncbi:hypothetical protein DFJ77DRAFT_58115 [Powellomyces hirtus]|nr:hypothetical protein DFJ77DRAFT_58115 [Powellomyces hirtus]
MLAKTSVVLSALCVLVFATVCSAQAPRRPPVDPDMWTTVQMTDMTIRAVSLTLMSVNVAAYWLTFNNKNSTVSRLILAFLLAYLGGIICHAVPKFQREINNVSTMYIGNLLFFSSAQIFNWVLWLRFNLVVPFRHKIRIFTIAWLTLETLGTVAIYIYWTYAVTQDNFEWRSWIANVYSKFTIAQAVSALFMSGYFVKAYYFPKIIDARDQTSRSTFARLITSGLFYLVAESLLHLGFFVLYEIEATRKYYSSLTQLVAGIRFMLFLVFVYQIRDASARSAASKLSGNGSGDHTGSLTRRTMGTLRRADTISSMVKDDNHNNISQMHTRALSPGPYGAYPNHQDIHTDYPMSSSSSQDPIMRVTHNNNSSSSTVSYDQPNYPAPARRAVVGFAQPPMQLNRVTVHQIGAESPPPIPALRSPAPSSPLPYIGSNNTNNNNEYRQPPDYELEKQNYYHSNNNNNRDWDRKSAKQEYQVPDAVNGKHDAEDWANRFVRKN